jgi:hypothetical protein
MSVAIYLNEFFKDKKRVGPKIVIQYLNEGRAIHVNTVDFRNGRFVVDELENALDHDVHAYILCVSDEDVISYS